VQQRFFAASEDAVRRAALQAFAKLDFVVHNSTAHEMEASKKGKLNTVVGAGTERVILHFSNARENGQAGTRVVGETKRGFMGRVTQKSWTSAMLAQISCNLRGGQ
jgi:tRNA(Leu) C34 or U34 (ribose-2'-O)-methylase TrmL